MATLGDRSDVIPSVAFLREDDVILVGHAAERRAVADATRVARAFKRRVGDPVPLWVGGRRDHPGGAHGRHRPLGGRPRGDAGGRRPHADGADLPGQLGDHRRALLLGAAAEAGVGDAELLAEPVAAAMHYSAKHRLPDGATVGVYDLGGGTFDATIVRRAGDGFETVGQPQGDDHLGGIDLDALVWDHMAGVLGIDALDLGDDPSPHELRALAQVRTAVVDAKEALSYDTQAVVPVTLPDLMSDVRITRAEFEELARPALLRTVDVFGRTCEAAGVAPGDLDVVLLVGGSSRIPMISQLVSSELGVPVATDAHPKLATCLGAAQAAEAARSGRGRRGRPSDRRPTSAATGRGHRACRRLRRTTGPAPHGRGGRRRPARRARRHATFPAPRRRRHRDRDAVGGPGAGDGASRGRRPGTEPRAPGHGDRRGRAPRRRRGRDRRGVATRGRRRRRPPDDHHIPRRRLRPRRSGQERREDRRQLGGVVGQAVRAGTSASTTGSPGPAARGQGG